MKSKDGNGKTRNLKNFYFRERHRLFSSKAQATVFMIIGIIALIATGTFLYVREQSLKEEIAPGIRIALEKVPTEFDPVKSFVTTCLEDTSVKGLKLIGKQGGYISLDSSYSGQTFSLSQDPVNSDAVEFAPGSGLKIPYWYYLSSQNDCQKCKFESKRPDLKEGQNSIQSQLSKYIENNLDGCIENFNALKERGFVIGAGNKNVETSVTENDVVVVLDYSLNAEKGDVKSSISQFFVVLPVNLQKIYALATTITNFQMQNRFLEKAAINLISVFSGVDKERLPPLTDTRFEFGSATNWIKTEVRDKVTSLLMSYISLFQVYNTGNYERNVFPSQLKQSLYDDFIVPAVDETYSDLEASFTYLDFWPIYFDLNCNGEFCEPESASSDILPAVGIQRYSFAYDISFPAYVEIKDPAALGGRGYAFNFFLEANLRNNEPLPVDFEPLQLPAVSLGSLLCDLSNRNSGDVAISVKDKGSSKPLDDVQITYTVTGETCFIGATDESGALTAKFPTGAAGGVVHFIKDDYLKKALPFDGNSEKKNIDVKIEPINTKNIVIKKKKITKTQNGWQFLDQPFDLNPKEEAILTLKRNSPLQDEEYTTGASFTLSQPSEINIAPGSYEAAITLMLKDKLVIPERKIKTGDALTNLIAGAGEYTIPGVEFSEENPFPSGGLRLNVTLNAADLENYDTIVFYAVSPALQDIPESSRVIEDLQESNRIEYYSNIYRLALKPAFQ